MAARIAVFAALLFGIVACGGQENADPASDQGAEPVAVEEAANEGDG